MQLSPEFNCMYMYNTCNFVLVIQLTRRSESGVLSPSGKCCSRAKTMQLAMMVARIIHSNGVRKFSEGTNLF